jgi:phage shock protein A
MSEEVREEELLRSIEEVEVRIQNFRKRVRAVLATLQAERPVVQASKQTGGAS